jgi:outer membrane immunogenic protein
MTRPQRIKLAAFNRSHGGLLMAKALVTGALITGALLGALVAGGAMAADMPTKAPVPMNAPPPVYNWTGCYIGAGGGYGRWDQDQFQETDPGHVAITATATSGGRGWFGTAGAGCDYQVSSSIVIGAYGDWDWSDIKGQLEPAAGLIVGTESQKWAWAAGGRIGWLVTPSVLTYVSGGYTQANFDTINFNSVITGAPTIFSIASHTYNGWFLGSGFDYAISFLPGLFLRTEYRYATYQADDLPFLQTVGGPTFLALNSKKNVETVRSELIWRFNWH